MPPRPSVVLTARTLPSVLRSSVAVSDSLVAGLLLRPMGAGRGIWSVRYTLPSGHRRSLTLGPCPPLGLEDARKEASAVLLRVRGGQDPAADASRARDRERRRQAPTLAEVCEQYIAAGGSGRRGRVGPLAPKTAANYRWLVSSLVEGDELVGHAAAASLRRQDFRGLLARALEHGPVAANRLHQLVRAACRWATSWEILEVDYTAGVLRPGAEAPGQRALVDEEIAALWQAAAVASIDGAVTVRLMILLGQRPAETASLRLSDFHADGELVLWQIPASVHKQRRGHVVPLPRLALEQLELLGLARGFSGSYPAEDLVLGVSVGTWRRWWAPIAERTMELLRDAHAKRGGRGPAPEQFTRHDLRRSVATGMLRLGVQPATISRVLGHSIATQARLGGVAQVTAEVYLRDRQVRESLGALTAWSEHVGALASGQQPARVIPFARP